MGAAQLPPPSRPVSKLVQEPILVKMAFQDTIILILTNSGRNNNRTAIPGKILLDLGSKIIIIINNHLQQYSHLLCRNKIIRLFLARLASHLVIVITRELLIMCNSAKIGQLSEKGCLNSKEIKLRNPLMNVAQLILRSRPYDQNSRLNNRHQSLFHIKYPAD